MPRASFPDCTTAASPEPAFAARVYSRGSVAPPEVDTTNARTCTPLELPAISAKALGGRDDLRIVDLRSPGEFALDSVPGAANVALFGDDERALVGTLYRRESPQVAFEAGLERVLAGVRTLVERIASFADRPLPELDLERCVRELTNGGVDALGRRLSTRLEREIPRGALVLHCWRGGLRSRSVAALLRTAGWHDVFVLDGGYRAWRRELVDALERFHPPPTYTLRGLTGVGKTLVLREIERSAPCATIDLEDLAQHRSSILGGIGLAPRSQKAFESLLGERLRRGLRGFLVVEGESRKVGDVIVPRVLWSAMESATDLELVAPLERRIEVLRNDYLAHPRALAALEAPLAFLDARLRSDERASLRELLARGEIDQLVTLLLERYYDPRYRHGEQGRTYAARFDASEPERCAREVCAWIERRERARGARDLLAAG